jgi:hypothetical protein
MVLFILLFSLCSLAILAFGYFYSVFQISSAERRGIYTSPEEGYRTIVDSSFQGPAEYENLRASVNAHDGSQPHVWFVSAKVHASQWKDGTPVKNGVTFPGLFFIKTRKGWVWMPEGGFPEFVGAWMEIYGLAGEVE